MAPGFTAKTGIKVNFVTVPTADIVTKLLLACQTKSSTNDVVQYDSQHLTALASAGCLDEVGLRAKASAEYQDSRIANQLKAYGTFEGKRLGLPLSTEPYVLWYRKDLYAKLGLKVPKTWTQYASNAKKCDAAGYYGSAIPYGPAAAAYRIGAMIHNYGGAFFDKSFQPTFDSAPTKAAIKMAMDLVYTTPASVIAGGGAVAVQAMQELETCQMLNATGWYSILGSEKQSPKVFDKLALADAPHMNGSKETFLFGWLIGINQYSDQKTNAWKFLEYTLGKTNAEAFLKAGAPPTGRTLVSGSQKELLAKVAPYTDVMNTANKNAIPLYRIPEITEVMDVVNRGLNAMATKQITFDAGIAKLNADVKAIFVKSGRLKG